MSASDVQRRLEILRANLERLAEIPQETFEAFASDFRCSIFSWKHWNVFGTSIDAVVSCSQNQIAEIATMTDKAALSLHDRSARGDVLTDEEERQLESWYATQDAAESLELADSTVGSGDLNRRIQASLAQVAETARQIQQTIKDNDSLRREIAGLRVELAQQSASLG